MCWLVGVACVRTNGRPGTTYLFIVRLLLPYGVLFSLCLGSSGCSAKVLDLLFGWHNWFGRRSSAIWNLAPLCVMWSLWQERNRRIFEDLEKPFSHLQEQFSGLLFDCSRSWGFTEASSLPDFVVSLIVD